MKNGINMRQRKWWKMTLVDFACLFDNRIEQRVNYKMNGYNDLKRELKKIWDMLVKVMPVVVGTLGTTRKKLEQQLSDIEIQARIVELQKTGILYSARVLRNLYEVWGVLLKQNLKKFNHWCKTYSVSNSNIIIIITIIIIIISPRPGNTGLISRGEGETAKVNKVLSKCKTQYYIDYI